MTDKHPYDKLAAVVDGELDHATRDKVLAHLVGCDECRAEVEAQRRLKARLTDVEPPAPSDDLTQRLLGLASFAAEPREQIRPVVTPSFSLRPQHAIFPAAHMRRPASRNDHPRGRRRTAVMGAAGSAAAVATMLGTAFVVGDPARDQQPPALQPPVSSFSADYATTVTGSPFSDAAVLLGTLPASGQGVFQPVTSPGR